MKIISGSQTGVDQAALQAAHDLGIETGGFVTIGNRTTAGIRPDLILRYNLTEIVGGYKDRTWRNVEGSDGTIRIANFWKSPGERCTHNAIVKYNKSYYDITPNKLGETLLSDIVDSTLRDFILYNDIYTLNIAGNSERTTPGIYDWAFKFLTELFLKWIGVINE